MRNFYLSPMKFRKLFQCFFYKQKTTCVLQRDIKFSPKSNFQLRYLNSSKFLTSCTLFFSTSSKFHTSAFHFAKHFQDIENEYSHHVMEKSNLYASVRKHPMSCENPTFGSSSVEEFNVFESISLQNFCSSQNIENDKFTSLINAVSQKVHEGTDEDIVKLLHCLCLWPPTEKTFTPNFKAIWNSLDEECANRLKNWDVSFQLLIADYWFHLRLSRITKYNKNMIVQLLNNINLLTNSQVVQLLFFINLQRKMPQNLLPKLETKLEKIIHSLSIEELGVICLGFFKTESKINDPSILKAVIFHFMKNINNVNTITVASVLKFFRKSLYLPFTDTYISLLHHCIPKIPASFDVPTSVHVALLSSECNVYHPLLLNTVAEKIICEINNARLKDCTKLLQCLAHYNHHNSKFYDTFMDEFYKSSRQDEVEKYPKDVVYTSLFHAYLGLYDYTLLSKVLNSNFVKSCCDKYPETAHIFAELDCCIQIECKDYFGNRLEKDELKSLLAHRSSQPSSTAPNMQNRLLNEVYQCLQELCGHDNVVIHHVLPHVFAPDIVVRLRKTEEKSLTDLYTSLPDETILAPPANEVWACFVVCGVYSFAYKSKHITGVTAMKLRQLRKLGYKVVFLPYYNISTNATHRKNYIKELLDQVGNSVAKQKAVNEA